MDKSKSTKLNGLIAKLTIAANKAVRKTGNPQKAHTHSTEKKVRLPFSMDNFDRDLHTAKLIK